MQLISTLTAFAAAATTVQALGKAIIINQCSFPTYLWPIDIARNPKTPTTLAPGGTWSETYHTPASGGVSVKISLTTACNKITQLEYTVQGYAGNSYIWYDGSNVDCTGKDCPFQPYGVNLTTSRGDKCPQRNCPAGELTCPGFYTVWNDDINSLSCDQEADTILTLCTGGGPASSVPKSLAPYSTTAAPVSPPKPAVTNEAVATTFVYVNKHARRHNHGHQ